MADKMTVVAISMPFSQYDKLRNAADSKGESMAKIVRDLLEMEFGAEDSEG